MGGGKCSICLDDMKPGDACIAMKCPCDFHEACLAKLLSEYKNACPNCNFKVDPSEIAPSLFDEAEVREPELVDEPERREDREMVVSVDPSRVIPSDSK